MSRHEFSRATKRAALPVLVCAWCSAAFDRGYRISSARAQNPQYCSTACRVSARKKLADDSIADRFWRRVERLSDNECWPWNGRVAANGYGVFDNSNRPHVASRFSYELANGHIGDPEKFVCHTCDNPICVNPRHLWLGTHQQNMDDAKSKGRTAKGNGLRGSSVNTSKLDASKVHEIRVSTTPAKILARKFGVSKTAIYMIRNGKNWGWLNVE